MRRKMRRFQRNLRCAAQCPAVVMESPKAAATPKLAIDPMHAIEGSASNCVFLGLPKHRQSKTLERHDLASYF